MCAMHNCATLSRHMRVTDVHSDETSTCRKWRSISFHPLLPTPLPAQVSGSLPNVHKEIDGVRKIKWKRLWAGVRGWHTHTHNRCTFSLDFLPEKKKKKSLLGSCGLDSAARPGDLKSVSWLGAASPDEGANNATCSVTPWIIKRLPAGEGEGGRERRWGSDSGGDELAVAPVRRAHIRRRGEVGGK